MAHNPVHKLILLGICLSVVAAELACSSSSSTSTSKPTVTLTTPPPASLDAGKSVNLLASITNDPTNSGVTWSCTPGNSLATCGSFNPSNTVATTYTAPPVGATVTITVSSVANSTASASASVTINAPAPTVQLTMLPPAAIFTGQPANLAAATTGDTTNQGVNWSCTPAATCGTFKVQTGLTAVYTAPTTAPPPPGIVTITASLVSYPTVSTSATVTVFTTLNGYYIYQLTGSKKNQASPPTSQPYAIAGVLYFNSGVLYSGEQDSSNTGNPKADLINADGSSFSLTADGHLYLNLAVCDESNCSSLDPLVGVGGVETLDASFLPLNPNKAFLTEFDSSVAASGTLDWRDPTVSLLAPSDGYVFELSGLSTLSNYLGPISMAGVIDIDGSATNNPVTISGNGSIFDACIAGSGSALQGQTLAPNESTVTFPDSFGRVVFQLVPASTDHFPRPINVAGYIVNGSLIRLEEISDPFGGISGGTAYGQGTNTGMFSTASISGDSYVFALKGTDIAGAGQATQPAQFAAVAVFNADGTISGFGNYNDLTQPPQGPNPITDATYSEDSGTGRVTITGASGSFNVGTNTIDVLEVYLDGSGHAVATVLNGSGNAIGGLGFLQTGSGSFTPASVNGYYAIDATGCDSGRVGEFDAVGPVTATGSSATFLGSADLNWLLSAGPTYLDLPVSGTLSSANSTALNGVFTGTITGLDVTTASNKDAFAFYLIDAAGDSIAIETDPNQLTLLHLFQQ